MKRQTGKSVCMGVCLAGALALPVQEAVSADWLTNYGFRQEISVVNMGNAGALSDAPVLISPTAGNDVYATSAHPNGWDIVFTSADGTNLLAHELVDFNPGGNTMEAWVKTAVPAPGATNNIYMYYSRLGVSSDPSSTAAWSSSYGVVNHFQQAAPGYADSTSPANTMNTFSGAPSTTNAGRFSSAVYFNGSSALRSSITNDLLTPGGYTVQSWVRAVTNGAGNNYAFALYDLSFKPMNMELRANGLFYMDDAGRFGNTGISGTVRDDTWHHLAGTFDGTTLKLYLDGALYASGTISFPPAPGGWGSTADLLYLGGDFAGGQQMKGLLDEFRLANGVWDATTILAHYNAQANPNDYLLFGQAIPEPGATALAAVGLFLALLRMRNGLR